jgi:hypothetical protein
MTSSLTVLQARASAGDSKEISGAMDVSCGVAELAIAAPAQINAASKVMIRISISGSTLADRQWIEAAVFHPFYAEACPRLPMRG